MNKYLMSFAACAILLTSCNQNEISENIDLSNGQLTFSPALGKQTRAAEIMNNSLQTGAAKTGGTPIKLFAYQQTGNNGTTWEKWFTDALSYNDDKWEIVNTRFRNTAATKFIAYWPQTNVDVKDATFGAATFEIGSFPTLDYEVKSTANEQYDLIASITDLKSKQTDIVFKMRHLLSQINFGVRGYKGAQITIKSITIKGVNSKGTYTFKDKDGSNKVRDRIGEWTTTSDQIDYAYALKNQTAVPRVAKNVGNVNTGDTYIFGDGGNAGPGRSGDIFYPIGTSGAWANADPTKSTGLSNSLMLLPQSLSSAFVEFEYIIQDIDGAFVAGGPNDPNKNANNNAVGKFSLDFTTGGTSGTDYLGRWEQNFRYVYIIDFKDFLDDNKLNFKVDVEAFPWENYNADGSDDGEVKIAVIGQPTEAIINQIANNETYYIASRAGTPPAANKKVQLVVDTPWDWSLYDFTTIKDNTGDKIIIDFSNVLFNGKNITLTLPDGFTATQDGRSLSNSKITANTHPVVITNTKVNTYADASKFATAVQAATATSTFTFTGDGSTLDLDSYIMTVASSNIITIIFKGTIPATIPSGAGWNWDANTKTATYTGQ